jgi:hypothetical protein
MKKSICIIPKVIVNAHADRARRIYCKEQVETPWGNRWKKIAPIFGCAGRGGGGKITASGDHGLDFTLKLSSDRLETRLVEAPYGSLNNPRSSPVTAARRRSSAP